MGDINCTFEYIIQDPRRTKIQTAVEYNGRYISQKIYLFPFLYIHIYIYKY